MIKEYYFPTPIYIKDIDINTEIEKNIIEWSKKEKGILRTNVKGWHSSTDMHLKKEYLSLINELVKMQKEIYIDQHLDGEPILGNMWANINQQGAYNKTHIHPNSLWSGVYYVKTPENCGNLYIEDPRLGSDFISPKRKKNNEKEFWKTVNYRPIAGRIIMFPAWLSHGVEINLSNDIRISVSFNFIQK